MADLYPHWSRRFAACVIRLIIFACGAWVVWPATSRWDGKAACIVFWILALTNLTSALSILEGKK